MFSCAKQILQKSQEFLPTKTLCGYKLILGSRVLYHRSPQGVAKSAKTHIFRLLKLEDSILPTH